MDVCPYNEGPDAHVRGDFGKCDPARRRITPSFTLALVALFVALAGTATAAVIIDSSSQIAKNVVTSGHVLNREVSQLDLKHPVLKLNVKEDGSVIDDDDGTAVRAGNGDYFVTFNAKILDAGRGGGTDTVLNRNCAITATPRNALALMEIDGPSMAQPNQVRVKSTFPFPAASGPFRIDTDFDITANC